jgi:hypothetical protein
MKDQGQVTFRKPQSLHVRPLRQAGLYLHLEEFQGVTSLSLPGSLSGASSELSTGTSPTSTYSCSGWGNHPELRCIQFSDT